MSNLICLLLGILIPLFTLAWIARRGLRPVAAAAAYRSLAWRLGLEADTRGRSVRGDVDGRRVFIGPVHPTRPTGPVELTVELTVPLGVGLAIRTRALRDRLRRPAPGALTCGDPALDERLKITAREPAGGLLDEHVRDALGRLLGRGADLWVDDRTVRATLRGAPSSERQLRELLDAMNDLAAALEHPSVQVALPERLAPHEAGWSALADQLGLTRAPAGLALAGDVGGRLLRVACVREADAFTTSLRLSLRAHAPVGLHLRPHAAHEPAGATGQDIVVGDPAFDQAYVIRGYDPSTVRALLVPAARAPLLTLAALGATQLTDRGLDVDGLSPDPDRVERAIRAAIEAAEALGW